MSISRVPQSEIGSFERLEARLLMDTTGAWTELGYRGASGGGISYDSTESLTADMALDSKSRPVVTWENGYTLVRDIYVGHYSGLNWVPLGQGAMSNGGIGQGHSPRIVQDTRTDKTYVAWVSGDPETAGTEIYLKYWDGLAWKELGGSATGGGISNDNVISEQVTLAVGVDGLPVVAYRAYDEKGNDFEIVCKKWNGQAWVELTNNTPFPQTQGGLATYYGGGVSDDVFNSFDPSLAIGPDNAPVIAWASRAFGQDAEIYLRRWDGMHWQPVGDSATLPGQAPIGGISNNDGESVSPRLLISPDPVVSGKTHLVVGWLDYNNWLNLGESAIYIRTYNSATDTWDEFTPGSATDTGLLGFRASNLDLDMSLGIDNLPLLTYARKFPTDTDRYRGFVLDAQDDGSGNITWDKLPDQDNAVEEEVNPALQELRFPRIRQAADGTRVIAYTNLLIDLSVTNPDIPPTGVTGNIPAFDPYYLPDIGEGRAPIDSEIFVQKYDENAQAWVSYSLGAADLGGIENSIGEPGLTYNSPPQLAVDHDGAPLMAYLHRVDDPTNRYFGQLVPRILQYSETLNSWDYYPSLDAMPALATDGTAEADLYGPATDWPFVNRNNWDATDTSWYGDMLLISSDPGTINNMSGVPTIAYVDSNNTDDPDPAVNGRTTITVWTYDDNGTPNDSSDDAWTRVGTGNGGVDAYAYVSPGLVADGWLIDQVSIIGYKGGKIAMFFRQTDPTATNNQGMTDMTSDPTGIILDANPNTASDIWGQMYDPATGLWGGFTTDAPENLTGATGWDTGGVNWSPTTTVTPTGALVLSFVTGTYSLVSSGKTDDSAMYGNGAQNKDILIPALSSSIHTYTYENDVTGWVALGGALPAAGLVTNPQLAIGIDGGPVVFFTQETVQARQRDGMPDFSKATLYPTHGDPGSTEPFHVFKTITYETTASDLMAYQWKAGGPLGGSWKQLGTNISSGGTAIMPSAYGNGAQFPTVAWTDAQLNGVGFAVYAHATFVAIYDPQNGAFLGWAYQDDTTYDMDMGLKTGVTVRRAVGGPVIPQYDAYSYFDERQWYRNGIDLDEYLEYLEPDGIAPDVNTAWIASNAVTTPGSERIFIKRWNPNIKAWEELQYRDSTNALHPSASGLGISQSWAPGVQPSLIIHTVGQGTLLDSQPVVAWDNIYEQSIYAREFVHDGLMPRLQIDETSGTANDNRIQFGELLTGRTGEQTIYLSNKGTVALDVSGLETDLSSEFIITDLQGRPIATPFSIPAGGSMGVKITANPAQNGPFTHYLRIQSSDPITSEIMLTLEGVRYNHAQITVNENVGIVDDMVVPFGIVQPGQISTQSFFINNLGTDPLYAQLSVSSVNRTFIPWFWSTQYTTMQSAGMAVYGGSGANQNAAQSFQLTADAKIRRVQLYLTGTGAPTDNFYVQIESDNAGKPSGVAITNGRSQSANSSTVTKGGTYNWYNVLFPNEADVAQGTKYWLVMYRDGVRDTSNYLQWGYDAEASTYAEGQAASNSADTWDTASYVNADFLFSVGTLADKLVIPANKTISVNVDFLSDAASANGIVAYAVLSHEDFENRLPAGRTVNPITLTLTANKPDFVETHIVAPGGRFPAIGREAISWLNGWQVQTLPLNYPAPAGLPVATISNGLGLPSNTRTDGNWIVWEENNDIWSYGIKLDTATNLTAGMTGRFRAPSISNGRIVYASDASGTWDISVMDLTTGQITAIPKAVAGNTDYWPDIDGNLVTWRSTPNRGAGADPASANETALADKVIFAYNLPTNDWIGVPFQITMGSTPGARIPSVSDGRIVWAEQVNNAYQIRYADTALSTGGVIVDQRAPINDTPRVDGPLVTWSSSREGNFDLYGYYFSLRPGETETGPAFRNQVFQLTYATQDEINPAVYGSLITYQVQTPTGPEIRYSRLPGTPNVVVDQTNMDFGKVYVGQTKTLSLLITNIGTENSILSSILSNNPMLTFAMEDGSPLPADYILAAGHTLDLKVTITPNANPGPFSALLTINSNSPGANQILVTVDATVATPHAPTLTTITPFAGTEDMTVTISYAQLLAASNAADADGDPLTFRIEALLTGTLTKNGNPVVAGTTMVNVGDVLVWTPDANANGMLGAFTVVASDGLLVSAPPVTVNANLLAVNDAPTLTTIDLLYTISDTFTITYDMLLAASDAADVDGDPISFRIEAVNSGTLKKNGVDVIPGSTLLSQGESLVWHSTVLGIAAQQAFTVVATDGQLSSSPPVQVNIRLNHAPVITKVNTFLNGFEDQPYVISFNQLLSASNAYDIDNDVLSFQIELVNAGTLTINGLPVVEGTTLVGTGDVLIWTPPANANGLQNAFKVKAFDGQLLSDDPAVQVKIQLASLNDIPTITTATFSGTEGQPLNITFAQLLLSTDLVHPDMGQTLTFKIEDLGVGRLTKNGVGVNTNTTLSAGESLVWLPPGRENGMMFAFTVTVSDGILTSTPALVQVDVAAINSIPSGQDQSTRTDLNTAVLISLDGSDTESPFADLLFNVPVVTDNGGTLVKQSLGRYLYTPTADFRGVDTFTYTVTDGGDGAAGPATSTASTVRIHVGRQVYFASNTPINFTDADGDLVTVTLKGGGTALLDFDSYSPSDLTSITLSDTTAKTTLNITAKSLIRNKAAGTSVQSIAINGPIKSFSAPTTDVTGGDITISTADAATVSSITLGCMTDVNLISDLPIKALTAVEWLDSGLAEEVSAPSLGTLKTLGRKATKNLPAVAGNFQADLDLEGNLTSATIAGGIADANWDINGRMGAFSVKGKVANSTIRTAGSMTSLAMGAIDTSHFLAGIKPVVLTHAAAHDDFLDTTARIGSIQIKGLTNPAEVLFKASNFSAASIGAVKMLNGDYTSGGIFARVGGSTGTPAYATPLGKVTATNKLDSTMNWTWPATPFTGPAGFIQIL